MSTINQELQTWMQTHGIRVLDTHKLAHRYHKVNMNFFRDPTDFNNVATDDVRYNTEPLYTVEIAESELIKIQKFEDQVFNNMRDTGHYNMFEAMMEMKQQEKYLRNKVPALQTAYEHYSLMLQLAESNEL